MSYSSTIKVRKDYLDGDYVTVSTERDSIELTIGRFDKYKETLFSGTSIVLPKEEALELSELLKRYAERL